MRRIVVTGANKGIGLAVVEAILAEHDDTFVYLGSRNGDRGSAARATLLAEHPEWADRLEVLEIDVSDEKSVAAAAARVADGGGLYAVVNNAGIASGPLRDILEVNTFGTRRVTESLLPLLSDEGRVVNVSSASGPNFVATRTQADQSRLTAPDSWASIATYIDECTAEEEANGTFSAHAMSNAGSYGLSKALVNAYTIVLAQENPGLRINACTPGFIETDLTRPFAQMSGRTPAEMGMKPTAHGARSTLFLLFGELEGNGRYYGSDSVRSPLDRYRGPGTPAYTGD